MKHLFGGLRGQLMALMAGSMLVTLAALAFYMVREQTALARAGIVQQAAAAARSIALGGEDHLVTGRLDVIEDLLLRSADLPGVRRVLVVDARGQTLAEVERAASGAGPLQPVFANAGVRVPLPAGEHPFIDEPTDGALLSAWAPVVVGKLVAWVRVDSGTEALVAIRHGIWRGAVGACLLALFGSLLLLHHLLRRPLLAVQRARDFAADLGQANGGQMAEAVGAREVCELVGALNRASLQLASQRRAIQAQLAQLRRQEAELAERNQRLAMVFALCPDGIVSFNADDVADFANPAFARQVGLAPEQIVGRSLSWLDDQLRAASAQPQGWQPLARVFEPARGDGGRRAAVRLARPRALDLALFGVGRARPSPMRMLYVRDVTHETEVDRLKSEFLSTAAHELRTPMASIFGFAELLRSRETTPERRAEMLETIHRQSRAMIDILNELLDLARIEARQGLDFEIVRADLDGVVRSAVDDFAMPPHRRRPQVQIDGHGHTVRIDVGKIAQVMRNLLSNAYKYSPSGGEVHVSLRGEGDESVVEVRDEGIGMTPQQLARVCERFYRADTSGAIPGTGLGMSIVKEIVELHGGRLGIHSEPGRGTAVTVRLPREAEALALA